MEDCRIHIIPQVKRLEILNGFLKKKAVHCTGEIPDSRVMAALSKLPRDEKGAILTLKIMGDKGEGYELYIEPSSVRINAASPAGAFYAVQTLRQIFLMEKVPCLHIEDEPDFAYRGFYHDVSRGKVPKLETLKRLVDDMAYYKLNSLQLYVEHTYPFDECSELVQRTGCLTARELRELDAYCRENFIDFIPSLATFGHMYEILEQEQYSGLRVAKEYEKTPNVWRERMRHHTIDPLNPGSIRLIRSLIDQYAPNFTSDYFNICGDETFDLKNYLGNTHDVGELYTGFINKIIAHVRQKGKKVMMWADIILQYPDKISGIPEDVCFLNWYYGRHPEYEDFQKIAGMQREQIVCPGTSSWNRFCENMDEEEDNISIMAEYGKRCGALGILNTNWGDWGNPCSIELAMYGLVLGAAKSWNTDGTKADASFYGDADRILYENTDGTRLLRKVSRMQDGIPWRDLVRLWYEKTAGPAGENPAVGTLHGTAPKPIPKTVLTEKELHLIQEAYLEIKEELTRATWKKDEYRQELLLAAEGICASSEIYAGLQGNTPRRVTDTKEWMDRYAGKWREKNKESELNRILEVFRS